MKKLTGKQSVCALKTGGTVFMWINVFRIAYWSIVVPAPFILVSFISDYLQEEVDVIPILLFAWLGLASFTYWLVLRLLAHLTNSSEIEAALEADYGFTELGLNKPQKRKRHKDFFSRFIDS